MDKRPIGIFDSGLGGLTVVKELLKELPNEDILYFGDTARVPYGTKSKQTITKFSVENALFLLKHNVKLIIVACNTSSSVALPSLRRNFKVPIVGVISPGVADAIERSKNKRIGVIGTSATIKSESYKKEILKKMASAKVFLQSCPLLVPLVEEGWLSEDITIQVISHYLTPLKQKNIDSLILGCTHYPLLKHSIKKVMGPSILLVDSAVSTAKAVKALLRARSLVNGSSSSRKQRFFVSDEPERFKRIGEQFLGKELSYVRKERI